MTSKPRGDADLPPGPARDLVALLRLLRGRTPLTIGQISIKSQLAAGHISEVLRGWKAPSPNAAEAIAVALGADGPTVLRARRLADALGELNRHTRRKQRAVTTAGPLLGSQTPPRVSPDLPSPATEIFVGRSTQISRLLTIWREHTGSLIQIVADGGTGKTTLVRRWLDVLDDNGDRPADLRWSFYSQGSHREAVDSTAFFEFAARALGIDLATLATGERRQIGALVARAFAARGGVLVLDGVEPLQHPPSVESGAVSDLLLQQMLHEFREILRSGDQRGHFLVVITTRWAIPHLSGPGLDIMELPLLSSHEGADLLRQVHLPATPDAELRWRPDPQRTAAELAATSREFAGHPLALTLLATYLLTAEEGDLARRATIPPVAAFPADIAGYTHARRVMGAYDRLFHRGGSSWDEACRQLLRVIGLFDRPAEPRLVDALCRPSITGLTDQLASAGHYNYAVTRLRDLRLMSPADPGYPEDLDTHPLIREHFGRTLEHDDPDVWTRAHARLAHTLERSVVTATPTTVPEMLTLYRAVAHGCRSREFAWSWSVFTERVQQNDRFTSTGKLGLTVAEVSALAGFFRTPWHEIADGMPAAVVGKALGRAAFSLRAVGRLRDASSAFESALAHHEQCGDLQAAADDANNYSVGLLQVGDLPRAVEMATRALRHTETAGGGWAMVKRHVNLAWLLHYEGRTAEARRGFDEAMRLLREHRPEQVRLRSTQGQRYGEFLLEADPAPEEIREAEAIGQGMIDHPTEAYETLDAAMGYLIRGRAESLLFATGRSADGATALGSLKQSVDLSRQTGHRDALVRCLLPLAAASRTAGDTRGSARYLTEAEEIIEQYEMRIYSVDCALERAWLALAHGHVATATEFLDRARRLRARHAPAYGRHARTFADLHTRCVGS